jgi:hypothetical protein
MTETQTNEFTEAAERLNERQIKFTWLDGNSKTPNRHNWTTTPQTVADYRDGNNIGIMTGALSGDLVCVDLDSVAALFAADAILPPTGMIEGRPGKPRSHRYYRVTNIPPHLESTTAAGGIGGPKTKRYAGVLDVQGTGAQVACPPSLHHSGEQRTWDECGEPAVIDAAELYGYCEDLAAACGWTPRDTEPSVYGPAPEGSTADGHRAYLPGVADIPVAERVAIAERYVQHCDPAVSGQCGHDTTFRTAAVLVIDFALDVESAKPLMVEWNRTCIPPWPGGETARKLAEVDKLTKPRGGKLLERLNSSRFTNCRRTEKKDERNRIRIVTTARPLTEIGADLHRRTGGWPRRVGDQLFVRNGDAVEWLKSTPAVFAWIGESITPGHAVDWAQGESCVNKDEFAAHLRRTAEAFDGIEHAPHEPPMPGVYYCHPPVCGNGEALAGLLQRFKPATPEDAVLLKALFLSLCWGGPCGQRPAWLIASNEDGTGAEDRGRGTGKTTLARMAEKLVGGAMWFDRGEQVANIQSRLLSADARAKRLAILDNVKSRSFSWAELEALITCSTVSGRQLYVGDGSRPNSLTWVLTINGASLSKDLSQRCIPLVLKRPAYNASWEAETVAYIGTHRWQILGDIVAELQRPMGGVAAASRWAAWEQAVLARAAGEKLAAVQAVIRERQATVDDDDLESGIIRDAFAEHLTAYKCDPDRETAEITAQEATEIICRATGEHWTTKKAVLYLKGAGIPELRHERTNKANRFIWRGLNAPLDAMPKKLKAA